MKKILFTLFIATLILTSCSHAVRKEYGTLVLDFDGSASGGRAIGSNGLPYLSGMRLKVEGRGTLSGSFVKDFSPEQPKNISLNLPIGDRLSIRVKAYSESGIWTGSSAVTVGEGVNAVSVKLNKHTAGLQNISFSVLKAGSSYSTVFNLGNKTISLPDSFSAFCRDSKGRMYIHSASKLLRYTAEGVFDLDKGGVGSSVPVADLKTGRVYGIDYASGALSLLKEDLTEEGSASIHLAGDIVLAAVHDNQLFVAEKHGSAPVKIRVFDITVAASPVSLTVSLAGMKEIADLPSAGVYGNMVYTDIMVKDGALYLVARAYNDRAPAYSLGVLIAYAYDKDKKEAKDRKYFGFMEKEEQAGIIPTGDGCFYGPVKFIGFEDDILYIADDGVQFEDIADYPRITGNKNRIAAFDTASQKLSFADTAVTWQKEEAVWRGSKTLVWKDNTGTGFDYSFIDGSPFLTSSATKKYTDVFCYDQKGNFYVLQKSGAAHKVEQYLVENDGTYKEEPKSADIGTDDVTAIAADISGVLLSGVNQQNALYYYSPSPSRRIGRISWNTDASFSTSSSGAYNGLLLPASQEVTALAANKDGFFVALRRSGNSDYAIELRKYAHGTTDYDSPASVVDIVQNSTSGSVGNPVFQAVYDMRIQEGRLYAVSYKTVGAGKYGVVDGNALAATVSGRLFDFGRTNSALSRTVLWEADTDEQGYAPYRFIAVKPRKLVIAGDGFYSAVKAESPENERDKILTFNLAGVLLQEDAAGVGFSRKLHYSAASGFVWY